MSFLKKLEKAIGPQAREIYVSGIKNGGDSEIKWARTDEVGSGIDISKRRICRSTPTACGSVIKKELGKYYRVFYCGARSRGALMGVDGNLTPIDTREASNRGGLPECYLATSRNGFNEIRKEHRKARRRVEITVVGVGFLTVACVYGIYLASL